MKYNFFPRPLRKYMHMSKRQRKYETQRTVWAMPTIYIIATFFIVAIPLMLDLYFNLPMYTSGLLNAEAQTTSTLVSGMVSGTLLIGAYTLNSILVVLTTFSSEYSPRMLLNFIADRTTQHILGVFYGSFVFTLITFVFVTNSSREYFTAVPISCVLVMLAAVFAFILFINHTSTWMQIHNIVDEMKLDSEKVIQATLVDELEPYRTNEPGDIYKDYPQYSYKSSSSGYVQLINFHDIISAAKEDDVVITIEAKAGDFVLQNNILFTFCGPGADDLDTAKYSKFIQLGHKRTEIQDVDMSMNKLSDIAIKSIGNDDPQSALNTFHKMAELMINVDASATLHPFLQDDEKQTRVVYRSISFSTYLHEGFGRIRHYATTDHLLILEMINIFTRLCDSISSRNHKVLWDFVCDTIMHISPSVYFDSDRMSILESLKSMANKTGHEKDYYILESHMEFHKK